MVHLTLLTLLLVATMRIGTRPSPEVHALIYDDYLNTDDSQKVPPEEEMPATTPLDYGDHEEANIIPTSSQEYSATTPVIATKLTSPAITFGAEPAALSLLPSDEHRNEYYSDYLDFAGKSKSYMIAMKSNLVAVLSSYSNSFHQEVRQYIIQQPSNRTIELSKYTRETCDCDGMRVSPCPLKCLYSCYGSDDNELQYNQDCRHRSFKKCECYGSAYTSYCDRGLSISNCFTTITETIPRDTECLEYKIDDKNVSKSFEAISVPLTEPIKKHFRGIETDLHYLMETSISVDLLRTMVSQMCGNPSTQVETTCNEEGTDTLRLEIDMYQQIKTNITRELLSTQKRIRDVYKSFKTLKEQHFTHISKSLKKYACCLKAFNVAIPNFNCTESEKEGTIHSTVRCPSGHLSCNSGKCIPFHYLCDGGADCPEGEDERYCRAG